MSFYPDPPRTDDMNAHDRRRRELLLTLAAAMTAAAMPAIAEDASAEARKARIQTLEREPSAEGLARKARSEALLVKQGIPINAHLPVIAAARDVRPRDKAEIARRALCLMVVALKGEGLEQEHVDRWLITHELQAHFTPRENAFLDDPAPAYQDLATFAWRHDAAWVLLWSLRLAEPLGLPTTRGDAKAAVTLMISRSTRQILSRARPRPIAEVLDAADLIYRCHWAVVDARLKGQPAPGGLNPDVVLERHWALNWLIGYMGQAWDDISTDT
jgi:hypothetical protein